MRRFALLPIAAFALAACTDVATGPTTTETPNFAVRGGGNPKFSSKDTDCSSSGLVFTCSYKVTGLGNTDQAEVTLSVPVRVSGQCENHGGHIVPAKDWDTSSSASSGLVRPENGQISGSLSVDASNAGTPSVTEVCPNGNWRLRNLSYSVGSPDLYAIVYHQDGSSERVDSEF